MATADLAAVGVLAGKLVRMHHDWDRLRFLTPVDPEKGYQRWFGTQLEKAEVDFVHSVDIDTGREEGESDQGERSHGSTLR